VWVTCNCTTTGWTRSKRRDIGHGRQESCFETENGAAAALSQISERVAEALAENAVMSTVNLSEVVARLADMGMPEDEIREAIEPLGLEFVDFDSAAAFAAGLLRPATKLAGLSLGDRSCLALGSRRGSPILTADRGWSVLHLGAGPTVEFIR